MSEPAMPASPWIPAFAGMTVERIRQSTSVISMVSPVAEPRDGAVVWALHPIFADAHGVAIGPEQAIFGVQVRWHLEIGHRRVREALLKFLAPDHFRDKAIVRVRPVRLDRARRPEHRQRMLDALDQDFLIEAVPVRDNR